MRIPAAVLLFGVLAVSSPLRAQVPDSAVNRALRRVHWGDRIQVRADGRMWQGILQRQRADTLFIVTDQRPAAVVLLRTVDSLWIAEPTGSSGVAVGFTVGGLAGAAAGIGLVRLMSDVADAAPSKGPYVMGALIGGVVLGFVGGALGSLGGPRPSTWKLIYPSAPTDQH